jgi:hypothetical protein
LPAAGCLYDGRPQLCAAEAPWLKDWSSSALRSDAPVDQPRERAPTEEWWRNFNDPVLDALTTLELPVHTGE